MGEARLSGPGAGAAVQRLVTSDVGQMIDGVAMYTVMCYEDGGIVDDCIAYRRAADEYLIVLNASNTAKDLAWIRDVIDAGGTGSAGGRGFDVQLADESDAIAVQGPAAVALCDSLSCGLGARDTLRHIPGRGIARPGYDIVARDRAGDDVVGRVTSGTQGISIEGAIGMGYVPVEYTRPGTRLTVDCRGKDVPATVIQGKLYNRNA